MPSCLPLGTPSLMRGRQAGSASRRQAGGTCCTARSCSSSSGLAQRRFIFGSGACCAAALRSFLLSECASSYELLILLLRHACPSTFHRSPATASGVFGAPGRSTISTTSRPPTFTGPHCPVRCGRFCSALTAALDTHICGCAQPRFRMLECPTRPHGCSRPICRHACAAEARQVACCLASIPVPQLYKLLTLFFIVAFGSSMDIAAIQVGVSIQAGCRCAFVLRHACCSTAVRGHCPHGLCVRESVPHTQPHGSATSFS